MKKRIRLFLKLWCVLMLFMFFLSFFLVRNSGDEVTFILWASPIGAFVWEDLFVFSLANVIGSVTVLLLDDVRYAFLFADIFWIVRSLGETFYWFLQQFNQPAEYPHNSYMWNNQPILDQVFGDVSNQKYFILFQISWQVITVFSVLFLIFILKNWEELGKKLHEK